MTFLFFLLLIRKASLYHRRHSLHSKKAKRCGRVIAFHRTHRYLIKDLVFTGNTCLTHWRVIRVG